MYKHEDEYLQAKDERGGQKDEMNQIRKGTTDWHTTPAQDHQLLGFLLYETNKFLEI